MKKYKDLYVPGAIVISAVLIAGAILFAGASFQGASLSSGTQAPAATAGAAPEGQGSAVSIPVKESDHVRGNPQAEITLVEFSDLECPFCKQFHSTVQQALAEYGDNIRWVYKHFPLDQIHPKADKEAEAAECAGELGGNDAFWRYIDRVFEITPSNNNLDLALLPQIAQDIGLNRSAFETCLDSGKYAQVVEDDYQQGIQLGVRGTPGSFVNGVPVPGAVPYSQLKAIIDSQL